MRIVGHPYQVLTPDEIDLILHSAFRILEEMGMEIHNTVLLNQLAEHGWSVDLESLTVKFPSQMVNDYIQEWAKYDWSQNIPQVSSTAGVYHGLYLDPVHNTRTPWTDNILSTYTPITEGGLDLYGDALPLPGALNSEGVSVR